MVLIFELDSRILASRHRFRRFPHLVGLVDEPPPTYKHLQAAAPQIIFSSGQSVPVKIQTPNHTPFFFLFHAAVGARVPLTLPGIGRGHFGRVSCLRPTAGLPSPPIPSLINHAATVTSIVSRQISKI